MTRKRLHLSPSEIAKTLKVVPIGSLQQHPQNARMGDPELIAVSLRAHGTYRAIVATRDGYVLAGNHLLQAALGEGMKEIAAHILPLDHDSPQAIEIMLADNRASDLSRYDDAALLEMLKSLDAESLEASLFDQAAIKGLEELLAEPEKGLTDPDDIPTPPTPRTKKGDVWQIGDHRVICGSATVADDYHQLLVEDVVSCLWSDPPYGVGIGAKNRSLQEFQRAGRRVEDLKGDEDIHEVEELWKASFPVIRDILPPGCPYYFCGPQGGDLGLLLLLLLKESGLAARHMLIWVKNQPTFSMGRLDYSYQHEPIAYGWMPGAAHPWHSTSNPTSILAVDRPKASVDHATAKPVDLVIQTMGHSTQIGDIVLDPFAGSGTTGVACAVLGRKSRQIEINPVYVDTICRRLQEFTGIKPVLESTGEEHDFTAQA